MKTPAPHRFALATILAGAALAVLGGCASDAPADAPAWFDAAVENGGAGGYPELSDVPQTVTANTNEAHWDRVQRDLQAAERAMKASPRNEPAPPTDAAAFEAEGRAEIEETRATH